MEVYGAVTLLLVSCVFCLLLLSWRKNGHCNNLPPGPSPLPFFGNLFQLMRGDVVQSLQRLSKKYGSIFTVYLGSRRVIILCGYDAVKEALVDRAEEFSGRGKLPSVDRVLQGFGVIFSNGERWKQLRRFSLMTLRNFGMGKRSIEERIQEEAQYLVEELKKNKGLPIDPTNIIAKAVSNVICSILFANRFDYEDEQFEKLLEMLKDTFFHMSSFWGQLYEMFPNVMTYIPGPHHNISKLIEAVLEFTAKRVKIRQESIDPMFPRDFIDCFLIKMEQEQNNPQSEFNMRNLNATAVNIFYAGTETLTTTLRFTFLLLLKHPEVAERLYEEINSTIGCDRTPCAEDRIKMPYTDAVIHEIQRFADVIPMNVPHAVTQDTYFRGYNIPKGTDVYPILSSVLYDSAHYKDPVEFNPYHFLDENGCFKKKDAFMPFSAGKRVCLGEGLARMELFMYITTILQTFKLKSLVAPTELEITPQVTGFANIPCSYKLSFIDRKQKHVKEGNNKLTQQIQGQ